MKNFKFMGKTIGTYASIEDVEESNGEVLIHLSEFMPNNAFMTLLSQEMVHLIRHNNTYYGASINVAKGVIHFLYEEGGKEKEMKLFIGGAALNYV